MAKQKIRGGYYIKARCIRDSDVGSTAPCIREIWDYLMREVNYKNVKNVKRGSLVRSIAQIREDLSWYVGSRVERYSRSQCDYAMSWLRNKDMITTKRTTRGLAITLCNYDYWSSPENYKEQTIKVPNNDSNNVGTLNDKQEGKERKEYIPPTPLEIEKYALSRGYKLDGKRVSDYYTTVDPKRWIDKNGEVVRNWKLKLQIWFHDENKVQQSQVATIKKTKTTDFYGDKK